MKRILGLLSMADMHTLRTILVVIFSGCWFFVRAIPAVTPVIKWITSNYHLRKLLRNAEKDDSNSNSNHQYRNQHRDISVSGIYVHPVKSMRAISLIESTVDHKGLGLDRRCMVVYELPLPAHKTKWLREDTTHRFLSQRQCPSLATISATISTTSLGTDLLLEHAPTSKQIRIPLISHGSDSKGIETPKKTLFAGIWDDFVKVDDMGDEAADFLQAIVDADPEFSFSTEGGSTSTSSSKPESKAKISKSKSELKSKLKAKTNKKSSKKSNKKRKSNGKIVRLVTLAADAEQAVSYGTDRRAYVPDYAKTWNGGFLGKPTLTDGFPILIASEASLEFLNQRLVAAGKEAIPMSRFRPNIVLKGPSLKPFEEDRWKVVAIGNTVFAIVKACPRCKQSCTDQITGVVSPEMEPLQTLRTFRRPNNVGDVFFAQNAIPIGKLEGAKVRVGDSIRVLETGDPVFI